MPILKPFVLFFFLKMTYKEKKLSLVTGADGNLWLSAACYSSSAEPCYCVNSPPRHRNPLCIDCRFITKFITLDELSKIKI